MTSIIPGWILTNAVLRLAGAREKSALRKASTFPRLAQARTLRAILEGAKDSEWGRKHDFATILKASSPEELFSEFRRRNAPTEFEDYRSCVDRMMNGESDILFEGKPLLYATTSGSTGSPKYVPLSRLYLKGIYGRMTRLWMSSFSWAAPSAFKGKMLTVVGKHSEGQSPDGTTFGSVSSFTTSEASQVVKDMYAVPQQVYDIEDYAARNYALMRFAIEKDITLWLAPNPSTIIELQKNVDEYLDDMIEDIGEGTLSCKFDVPAEIRAALAPRMKPNPARAFALRALQSQYDRVLPRYYWPNLKILSTWKCGNTQIYLKKMAEYFRYDMLHRELGYFATECRAGLVLDDALDSMLMPHMHYYEFRREKDLGDPEARFYNLWELKEGERYCPYVTTCSGLYRYNMNDIVQVGPSFYNTPRVHMVQKVNGIVSITGEKLYEAQFIAAVDKAQESTGMKLSYYTGYVNLQESRYDWYFEFADRKVNQKKAEEFASVVDANLKALNIEYESKRNSFRLKEPAVFLLVPNAFEKFKEIIMNISRRDSSRFKPNVLAQDEPKHRVIDSLRQRRGK